MASTWKVATVILRGVCPASSPSELCGWPCLWLVFLAMSPPSPLIWFNSVNVWLSYLHYYEHYEQWNMWVYFKYCSSSDHRFQGAVSLLKRMTQRSIARSNKEQDEDDNIWQLIFSHFKRNELYLTPGRTPRSGPLSLSSGWCILLLFSIMN